jgi:hypothetical protein
MRAYLRANDLIAGYVPIYGQMSQGRALEAAASLAARVRKIDSTWSTYRRTDGQDVGKTCTQHVPYEKLLSGLPGVNVDFVENRRFFSPFFDIVGVSRLCQKAGDSKHVRRIARSRPYLAHPF